MSSDCSIMVVEYTVFKVINIQFQKYGLFQDLWTIPGPRGTDIQGSTV